MIHVGLLSVLDGAPALMATTSESAITLVWHAHNLTYSILVIIVSYWHFTAVIPRYYAHEMVQQCDYV
jgi:hypothetical protein